MRGSARIDLLVNNAGEIQAGPLESMALEDFERALRIMFWGTVYPTWTVLPQMRERQSGRIVNITSIGAKVAVPHLLPYTCAKFAMIGFSEGLRAELAGKGIQVVTIAPA
jgi:NAD(P)-dependent dehydrogenase (short-subunit alcohol dehydrogenase family)